MLSKLLIKNFALMEELGVEFAPGFNVLTGETGAGKSLVINALNSILGEKISLDMLRKGTNKSIVEGNFHLPSSHIQSILTQNDIDVFDNELILRRELNQSGRSRTFVNDCVTQIDVLKEITNRLVDLHGQHEHQFLLAEENHIQYLDIMGSLTGDVAKVQQIYNEVSELLRQKKELLQNAQKLKEKREFLLFQISEIETLSLSSDEEEELLKEEKILENYEKLVSGCNDIFYHLYDNEQSVYSLLGLLIEKLEELKDIDEQFVEHAELLSQAYIQIEEVARFVSKYMANADFDADRLEQVRLRLNQLSRLKKKYGLPLPEILQKYKQLKLELDRIENFDEELKTIEKQVSIKKTELKEKSKHLSSQRKKIAHLFEDQVISELKQIGMERTKFKVNFEQFNQKEGRGIELEDGLMIREDGQDKISFLIQTNVGENFKPLAKIVSGGELSRIMLAIKSVLAEKDKVDVLVFDEIDIGISGRIAEAVGKKLKDLAKTHQLICVTHLPQIASFADKHFSVRKTVKDGQTFTYIQELNFEDRIQEIAYLLGGEAITDAVLDNAREMLSISEKVTSSG